jgi:hypothetical protein
MHQGVNETFGIVITFGPLFNIRAALRTGLRFGRDLGKTVGAINCIMKWILFALTD